VRMHRIMGQAGTRSQRFVIATALMAIAALGMALSAMATPKGAFAVFAQCPVHAAEVDGCLYSPTTSGYIKLGKQEVPIVNKQVLQGGLLENEPSYVKPLSAALNGETLTKTAQKSPAGFWVRSNAARSATSSSGSCVKGSSKMALRA